jgi:tRNA-dihydrouridine synthase
VPADLAACARLAEQAGYDEVNLNVGCPSDRVQNNMIGACLMATRRWWAIASRPCRMRSIFL